MKTNYFTPREEIIPIFRTKARVPQEVSGLACVGTHSYVDPNPGVRIRYESGITKADVHLYDLGMDVVPQDIESETIMDIFDQACEEVILCAEDGMYLDLEVKASQYMELLDDSPEPAYLWTAFRYRQSPEESITCDGFRWSHLFLRSDAGFINKIRYTYPESKAKREEMRILFFLHDWYQAVENA